MINHQPLKTKGHDRRMQDERPHIDGPALVAEWVGILPTLDTRDAAAPGRAEGAAVGLGLKPLILSAKEYGTENQVDDLTITRDDQEAEGAK